MDGRLANLFDTHHARLYRLARRLAPTGDEALDLVQDTFLKAARSPCAVPFGVSAEEAWLVRILVNLRHDQWRKVRVRDRHTRSDARTGTGAVRGHEDTVLARVDVWRALDVLTPRRRAVVILHELEGLPISDIAALLGITAITVRWHLAMGRRDLARRLASHPGGTHVTPERHPARRGSPAS